LNLTTGRNLPGLYKAGKLPNWTRESKKAIRTGRILLQHIGDRYHSVYGGCFIPEKLRINYEPNGKFQWLFDLVPDIPWTKLEGMPPVEERMFDCVEKSSAVKLVAITLAVTVPGWNGVTHAQLLIINKVHRTVELYDPNGWDFVEREIPGHLNVIQTILERIFTTYDYINGIVETWPLEKYTFVPIRESNMRGGLQAYEVKGTEACYSIGGFCAWWTLYYAELRAQQVNDTALTFKLKMKQRMGGLQKAGIDLGKYFRDVILDYVLQAGYL
jgi:hypothetical protein